jgi:hypothetical protein
MFTLHQRKIRTANLLFIERFFAMHRGKAARQSSSSSSLGARMFQTNFPASSFVRSFSIEELINLSTWIKKPFIQQKKRGHVSGHHTQHYLEPNFGVRPTASSVRLTNMHAEGSHAPCLHAASINARCVRAKTLASSIMSSHIYGVQIKASRR